MSELFSIFLIQLALLKATPLILAAMGGLFSERSGISNIALEGMMLGGAFSAIVGSYFTGSALIGVLSALMAGGLLGYIFALSCIKWEANQIVSGAAINILAVGLTGFFLFEVFGFHGSSPAVAKMPLLDLPWMDKLPLLGHPLRVMIFQQSPLFGISILLVAFA